MTDPFLKKVGETNYDRKAVEKVLTNLFHRVANQPTTLEEVIDKLQRFTAPPEDGDYDQHVHDAIKATFELMRVK